ncbi:hypothetical protein NHP190003_07900 [Helicobacter sp. NHP19-003]|uniref:Uncharacterized protein n=1 Tax=Helicobacter gastrocanis TaxID=2849641 RepID=A0ABN6I1T3_9HELI|nr:hypothetical protein NHP190003_07900 [Helicobacter sp. NHP19-003]
MLEVFLTPSKKPPHVLVVGDIIIDHYIWGQSERLSPEALCKSWMSKKRAAALGGGQCGG